MDAELYTIGYERHFQLESLIEKIRGAGVRRVVDVRELPLSRRRGFSKSSLAEAFPKGQGKSDFLAREGNDRHLSQVVNQMLASAHYSKIFRRVVQRITVNVVYDLIRPKFAAERGLRNHAMLGHLPSADGEIAVALIHPALAWITPLRVVAANEPVRLSTASSPRVVATPAFA